jgi:ubiquinone/menaquinone biosynthesis C-methylase UbiE
MSLVKSIFMRAFGHPRGVLGKLGGIVMARMNLKIYHWAIELLEVGPSDRILEIGFGPGVGIRLLASAVSSGRVAGVDASEEMLEQASVRNVNSLGTGRGDLQQASVESLPFKDASFDKVLAVNSMRVWPDAIAGLREIRRVPKPDGRVVLGFSTLFWTSKGGPRGSAYGSRIC